MIALRSRDGLVFIAAVASIAAFIVVDVLICLWRGTDAQFGLVTFRMFLLPLLFFPAWIIAAVVFALHRRWMALAYSLICPALVALTFTMGFTGVQTMLPLVQRVEFAARKPSYEALVEKTPKSREPRLMRVSYLDTSVWCCSGQTFEEIWFDESDSLGKPESSERDKAFWSSHPAYLGHTWYSVRSLGDHYYFLDISY
jgi:hypothetical protein